MPVERRPGHPGSVTGAVPAEELIFDVPGEPVEPKEEADKKARYLKEILQPIL